MIKLILVVLSIVSYGSVEGFPENSRLGYSSCQSCHVSPSGGGVLTEYGKSTAEEISMFSYEGAGKTLWNAYEKEYVLVGGDLRYLTYKIDSPGYTRQRKFLMQADLELAVPFGENTFVSVSQGYYGIDTPYEKEVDIVPESRRFYLLTKPREDISLRVGKFTPAFGLMIPDHRAKIRSRLGYGQGTETMNFELGLFKEYGEALLTRSMNIETKENATHARLAKYVGKASQLGFQLKSNKENLTFGYFGIYGITSRAYIMAEIDRYEDENIFYGIIGYEILKGFHVRPQYQFDDQSKAYALELQVLPFPHFEMLLKYEKFKSDSDYDAITYMSHYYF